MPQTEQQTMREIVYQDEDLDADQKRSAWCHLMGALMYLEESDSFTPERVKQAVQRAIKAAKQ